LGGHVLARVARRRQIWHPQQHHHQTHDRFIAFLGTFDCPAQQVWLPGNDLQDPATWMPPPLCQLKQMHEDLLQHYDYNTMTAQMIKDIIVSVQQHSPHHYCQVEEAETQMQTRSISQQAPKTTATANSSFHSSTHSTRHSN